MFELVSDYFRQMGLSVTLTGKSLTEVPTKKRVVIFSNVAYAPEQRIATYPTDFLVFINKANCAEYYRNDKVESISAWRRKDEEAFGLPKEFLENHLVLDEVPADFLKSLSDGYDWNFTNWDGRRGAMTTGYIVVKYMEHLHPDSEIVLVNFGFEVKHSTIRTPNHNWKFEDREFQKFKHLYTGEKLDYSQKFKLFYNQHGWLGDNVYASAVLRNLYETGMFRINVNRTRHPELWTNCPFLDDTVLRRNADFVCKQHYRGTWRIGCKHIIEGTTRTLTRDTGIDIPIKTLKPEIWVDLPAERLIEDAYIIINTGWQNSAETKKWNADYWRQFIAMNPDKRFIQIGQTRHHATPIEGAENWIDKTDIPKLAQLVRDAECVISPPSGVIHMAAAFDTPFISIAGGREPKTLASYPCGVTLTTCTKLSCCHRRGCHRNSLHEGGRRPCIYPEKAENETMPTARCMNMITPEMVQNELEKLLKKEDK